MIDIKTIYETDPEIASSIKKELKRQRDNIELIASENFVSPAVMAASGTHLTNKYAEGYPGKRYYGGCEFVDEVETLAIERAKKLFNAEFANVQSHSGADANMAVFNAFLDIGDTVLSMSLAHGGHLSHGSPVNFSGRNYNIISYGVTKDTNTIDYNELEDLALKNMPKLILAGASAYPRKIDFKKFRKIADLCGAIFMVDIAHIAGLVIAGEHENPFPYADVVTTTTHKTLRGPRGGMILSKEKYGAQINKAVFPGMQGGPLMHTIAAKAISFKEAMSDGYKKYQHQIVLNAKALSERLTGNGIRLVSGGTDNHLMLIDLTNNNITGKELEKLLDSCRITVNKNAIPFDTQSPFITSGIRVGTPSVTTRGMKEAEMLRIADLITMVIKDKENAVGKVKGEVDSICKNFPLYEGSIIE